MRLRQSKEKTVAKTWTKVGTYRATKAGGRTIKLDADFNGKAGMYLNVQDPRKKLEESVNSGRLTEAKAEELLSKIPDYILEEVYFVTDN